MAFRSEFMKNHDELEKRLKDNNLPPFERLKAALNLADSGRWQWDEIDFCWTGKYADLDAWGYQGLHLDKVEDGRAYATVHTGKTIPGDDVTLNIPDNITDDVYQRVREIYLEQAQEAVIGCGYSGDWSGDDWFLTDSFQIVVPYTTPEETVIALESAAMESLKEWEKAMGKVDSMTNQLAGWENHRGKHMQEGHYPKCSVWAQYRSEIAYQKQR
jgi:hypothetical protein